MKKKLELNIYDINEIKESAIKHWKNSNISQDEPVVKSHIEAFFDFLHKYGYLDKDLTLTFSKDRIIRRKVDSNDET